MTKEYRQYKKALKVNSANDMVFKTKRRMLSALNVVSSVQQTAAYDHIDSWKNRDKRGRQCMRAPIVNEWHKLPTWAASYKVQ